MQEISEPSTPKVNWLNLRHMWLIVVIIPFYEVVRTYEVAIILKFTVISSQKGTLRECRAWVRLCLRK